MYYRKIFVVIILCAGLSACSDQKIVNEICLIHAISFDTAGDGIKSAGIISHFNEREKTELQVLRTEPSANNGYLVRLNTQTNDPVEKGQLSIVLFGNNIAEKGIGNEIYNLHHDPKISSRLQLGVADRDASELLDIIKKTHDPFYLSDMVQQNIKNNNLPLMNLHVSLFNYYGEGRDMFLPYFKIVNGGIKIDGLALFRSDRKITEISMKDAFLLKMLIQNSKNGSFAIPVAEKGSDKQDDSILIRSMHSKANYIVHKVNPIPSILIQVKLVAQLQNVPDWVDLRSEEKLKQLEKIMGTYFEEEIEKFLSLIKKNNVDPIGLGDIIRSRSKKWNAKDFEKIYQMTQTTVNVQVKIDNTGSS